MPEKTNQWLSVSDLYVAIPSKHRAGSIVFFPPVGREQDKLHPGLAALRIDSIIDGDEDQLLLWLQDDPWQQNKGLGSVDACRDHELNTRRVLGMSPDTFSIQVQFDPLGESLQGDELTWRYAIGWLAINALGAHVVAGQYQQIGGAWHLPVSTDTWSVDNRIRSQNLVPYSWYKNWRIVASRKADNVTVATFGLSSPTRASTSKA